MLNKSGLFPIAAIIAAVWLVPVEESRAVHVFGHGLDAQTSAQQIDRFCKQYPALIASPNISAEDKQRYKKLYQQHCGRPAAKPTKPVTPDLEPATTPQPRLGRIERIQPPACLERGAEIRVRGKNLRGGGLDCRLAAGSRHQSLQAYSRTAQEFRFRLDDLQAAPDYVLQCDVDGGRERINLKGCDEPGAPGATADVDLAAEIRAGVLRPGETQTVEVLIPNRGRSRVPRNERFRVMLALVDRDLTRAVRMKMGGREALIRKSQWMTRVPAAGQSERASMAINVPGRVPETGSLHWCAFADHEGQIPESNERNNLACVPATGGVRVVARDDLTKLFGSAVRNQNPGGRIPDEGPVAGDGDSSPVLRTMMHEGDGGQSGIAVGEAPEGIHETATLDGIGLDPAALQARIAELPAVQQENESLPGVVVGSLGDRGLGPRADAIEQANQARGLNELSELARSGLAVPGFEGSGDVLNPGGFDIANRDTGNPLDSLYDRSGRGDADAPFGSNPYMPEGTAPRNQEGKTPNAGKGAGWLVPSMNPRDWAGGASSQDGGGGSSRAAVFKTPDGTVEKRYMREDGTVVVDTNHGSDGEFTRSTREERNTNGTRTYTDDAIREDGSGFMSQTTYDQRGNPIYARQTVFGPGRTFESDMTNDQPGNQYNWRPGPMHPDRTQDPNAPGYSEEFARWHSQFDHSKKKGAPIINRVNPGPDGATPNPRGPRLILPESQLTGNPSPDAPGAAARNMDAAAARQTRERLIEKIRGPGGHPGDERGDTIELP